MLYKKFTFRMAYPCSSLPFGFGPTLTFLRYGHSPQLAYRITNVCANGMPVFVFKRDQ